MLEKKQHYWEGLAVGYFFLAALGAMTFVVAALLDFAGAKITVQINGWVTLASLVITGIGALLLLLELGNKFKFLLVFRNPSSIMTLGAYALSLFMVMNFLYTSFFFTFIPWAGMEGLRKVIAFIGILAALFLVSYPGLELGEARGRKFWSGSALVPLFLIAGASTGVAGFILGAILFGAGSSSIVIILNRVLFGLLVVLLISVIGYIWGMKHSGQESAERAVDIILQGIFKNTFYGGLMGIGVIMPLILNLLAKSPALLAIEALCVIIGGACFRSVFLQSAVRTGMPGEEREWYEEKELKELAKALDQRWEEKRNWLYR